MIHPKQLLCVGNRLDIKLGIFVSPHHINPLLHSPLPLTDDGVWIDAKTWDNNNTIFMIEWLVKLYKWKLFNNKKYFVLYHVAYKCTSYNYAYTQSVLLFIS